MACVCLYVYECALLEKWMYVLCYVSYLRFFLPIQSAAMSPKAGANVV